MIVLWTMAALAADVDRYPWQAEVTFGSEGGVHRIEVPALLRSAADPVDGSDLLLVDAAGRVVPVAWARGSDPPARVPLSVRPTAHDTWEIGALDRPIDGLQTLIASGAATVTVTGAGAPVEQLVWRLGDNERTRVDLPPSVGPFTVTLTWHQDPGEVGWVGLRDPAVGVRATELTLPVVDWRLEERGFARYTVPLPHPLPVQAVHLLAVGDVFERGASVYGQPLESWDWPRTDARVSRVHLGTARADRLRVPTGPIASAGLVVYVEAERQEPLVIPEVRVELPGVAGFARDPGPGPHTLYGGAPPGTSPSFDLAVALPELAGLAARDVAVGPVVPNPAHVSPEVRTGLGAPGPQVDAAFAWRRGVTGSGLTRVPLDAHALRHARSDFGDVRLVTPEGRQVPYLLRRVPVDQPMDVTMTRTEDGATSRIVVTLPDDRPVSTVTVRTDAPLFSRRVVLSRGRGAHLEPVRAWDWSGGDRPVVVTLDVDQVLGTSFVIAIENGSNPPLPVTGVEATWPAWEVVAVLPPEGAELRYGAPRLEAPSYDLSLIGTDVGARAVTLAAVAEPIAVAPPPRSWWDEIVLLGGLVVLALGLLGLTVSLVRGVPQEAPAEA